ncbi:AfsR/SARP family transcriptional regulator [Nonomuraea angiospora]|uniref:AfsR/SARP family transcriptional regulator n=1 Tax=Nonomuraea angiospora TaxID=46172 RepID=UPI0029AB27E1|nr:BTAD domain-containing putative transcriptional regulator [Nonomuraea angiospora]MDX3107124.1 BTAD domain-containing putative transcriptional regulator [Nonomuraea angiospora]
MSEGIFIRLLGEVTAEFRGAEEPIDLGPARQRTALSILAAAATRPVPMDRLVAGVWGENAPRNAEQSVYTYVAGLRRAFEPDRGRREPSRVLAGTPAGYVLQVEPVQVDALLFAEWVEEARRVQRAGDDPQAVRHLDEALALWRGTALSGLPGPFAEAERDRLEQLRLAALELRAESLLRLGRHRDIVEELRDLTRRNPLRERVRELLMTALFQSGNPAEALQVYEEGRILLAEKLGVSPGEGLRRCHEMVLRTDAASATSTPAPHETPHQLPRPLAEFVGRSTEIARLKERLTPRGQTSPSPLVIITGPPGVGKSALAAYVAHLAMDRFPDGQLYVNCRGTTPKLRALTPLDVLGRFLRALGVPPSAVPADLDEAAAAWRSRLHGRRVLVVLDDAADLAQIRPLLSASLGNTLLVTSRETMSWGEDAVQLELARMSPAESATMLAGLAGASRISADAGETARLVRLCDGLPLALRIAGARLAGRPDWSVSALAARLSDERTRLHELAAGDLAVRSSLAGSHTALERGSRPVDRLAARMLSLLGLLHVPEMTAEVAAALAGVTSGEAEAALERLVDAHLLERAAPDRYQLHDLVRLFAGELRPADWRGPLIRALSYFAASTRLASHVSDPHRMQPAAPVDAIPHSVDSPDEAMAWLHEEEAVLAAAAVQALNSPDDTIAQLGVNLTFGLLWHQVRGNRIVEMNELNTLALQVSERLGDEASALIAHGHIANALRISGRTDAAVVHQLSALELARRIGDASSEMRALGNLANTYNTGERHEEALPWAERQLALARRIGARVGERFALMSMGNAYVGAGRPEEALKPLHEGLADAEEAEDGMQEGQIRFILGEVYLDLNEPRKALEHFHKAVELLTANGYRVGVLRGLIGLSRAHRMLGDLDLALSYITEAAASGGAFGHVIWERRLREERAAVDEARGVIQAGPCP